MEREPRPATTPRPPLQKEVSDDIIVVCCCCHMTVVVVVVVKLVPVGLPAPELEAVRSDAISVQIFEPLQPNGEIVLYNIIL